MLTCVIIQQSYVVVVVFCSWMLSCLVAGSKCVTSTEEQREVWRVLMATRLERDVMGGIERGKRCMLRGLINESRAVRTLT